MAQRTRWKRWMRWTRWTRAGGMTLAAIAVLHAGGGTTTGQIDVTDPFFAITTPIQDQVRGIGDPDEERDNMILIGTGGSVTFSFEFEAGVGGGSIWLFDTNYEVMVADGFVRNTNDLGAGIWWHSMSTNGRATVVEDTFVEGGLAGLGSDADLFVENFGRISAWGADGAGVSLFAEGEIINRDGGRIEGTGTGSSGIVLWEGGEITNESGGRIEGRLTGIWLEESGDTDILNEDGAEIIGENFAGIRFTGGAGGDILNEDGGLIEGYEAGIVAESSISIRGSGVTRATAEDGAAVVLFNGGSAWTGILDEEVNLVGGTGVFEALGSNAAGVVLHNGGGVTNPGDILGGDTGVRFEGGVGNLFNGGLVEGGQVGVRVIEGARASVVNQSGFIVGLEFAGVYFERFLPDSELINQVYFGNTDGLIVGAEVGVFGDNTVEVLNEVTITAFEGPGNRAIHALGGGIVLNEKVAWTRIEGEATRGILMGGLGWVRNSEDGWITSDGDNSVAVFLQAGGQVLNFGDLLEEIDEEDVHLGGIDLGVFPALIRATGEGATAVRIGSGAGTVLNLREDAEILAEGTDATAVRYDSGAGGFVGNTGLIEAPIAILAEDIPATSAVNVGQAGTLIGTEGTAIRLAGAGTSTVQLFGGSTTEGDIIHAGPDNDPETGGTGTRVLLSGPAEPEAFEDMIARFLELPEEEEEENDNDEEPEPEPEPEPDGTYDGNISGFHDLRKVSDNHWRLTGDLGFNSIDVREGDLVLEGTIARPGDQVRVLTDATLDVSVITDAVTAGEIDEITGTLLMEQDSMVIGGGQIIGNVSMFAGSTMSPGDSIGTLDIDGDVLFGEGSLLIIEIDTDEDPFAHDSVAVTGIATVEPDSRIQMVVTGDEDIPASIDPEPDPGAIFDVVTTGDGIVALDINQVQVEGSFPMLYAWQAAIEGNNLQVIAHDALHPVFGNPNLLVDFAIGARNKAIAEQLQLRLEVDPDEPDPLVDAIRRNPTQEDYNVALATLTAEPVDAMIQSSFRNAQTFQAGLGGYLSRMRPGTPALTYGSGAPDLRMASAARNPQTMQYALAASRDPRGRDQRAWRLGQPRQAQTWNAFAQGVGTFINQNSDSDRTGFVSRGGGGLIGVDHAFRENVLIGAYVGGSFTDIDFRGDRGDGQITSVRGGPFISLGNGGLFLDASATFAYHFNDVTRRVVVDPDDVRQAESSFHAFDVSAHAATGYNFYIGDTSLTPMAGVRYTHYRQQSYNERGADDANLSLRSLNADSLQITVGGRIAHYFQIDMIHIVPEISAGWQHEFLNDSRTIRARFVDVGTPMNDRTGSPTRDAVVVGGGISALLGDNASAFVRYDGEFADDRDIHTISGGLNIRF